MADTRFAAARGFTLIELIISMVLLGIAATTVVMLSSNIFRGLQENRDNLAKSQLMQECFESLLAKGKKNFTDPVLADEKTATAFCKTLGPLGDYSPATVSELKIGASDTIPACPWDVSDGKSCKLITIKHDDMPPLYLMLVESLT